MLTDPLNYGGTAEDIFEVVCPSIPGFGYSEAAHKPGRGTPLRTNCGVQSRIGRDPGGRAHSGPGLIQSVPKIKIGEYGISNLFHWF